MGRPAGRLTGRLTGGLAIALLLLAGCGKPAPKVGQIGAVEGFLGGNSNPTSGDFSYGVLGTLVEDGKDVRPVSEMNVSGNVFTLLDSFVEAANDPWVYSSWRVPTLLFDDIQFSGT